MGGRAIVWFINEPVWSSFSKFENWKVNQILVLEGGKINFEHQRGFRLGLSLFAGEDNRRMERIHVSVRARPLSSEDAKTSPWKISSDSIFMPNHSSLAFEFGTLFQFPSHFSFRFSSSACNFNAQSLSLSLFSYNYRSDF